MFNLSHSSRALWSVQRLQITSNVQNKEKPYDQVMSGTCRGLLIILISLTPFFRALSIYTVFENHPKMSHFTTLNNKGIFELEVFKQLWGEEFKYVVKWYFFLFSTIVHILSCTLISVTGSLLSIHAVHLWTIL